MVTTMSSRVPMGLIRDLFANSKIIGVGLIPCNCKDAMVLKFIALIVAPKSTRVFDDKDTPLISMVTIF